MNGSRLEIGAVILAAGNGSRIGSPKALLPLGEFTFLEHVLRTLHEAGLSNVVAVVSPFVRDEITRHLADARIAVNPDPASDMMTSLRLGVAQLSGVPGCFIVPVDHPFVRPETYRKVMEVFEANSECVVVPTHREKGGHPTLVPFTWIRNLPAVDFEGGLRRAIQESGVTVLRVPVNDPGILRNVNTPSDLSDSPQ